MDKSQSRFREYLDKSLQSIRREKEYLADSDNLAHAPDTIQEILRLNLIEDWLLSEINRLENPHPWDTKWT